MPSIIEGYSYDIFISYRQNDNKYDGWVTEFVDNLNKELEANIKDKVSVYFDINPDDGLLETHSVDRSLEDKLKCLIFIPIISSTYCDPKSFAWQHEFCVFNKLAKEEKFGRDIRLSSGNVASRILPVKIHELDPEDKMLLENEIGGVLRCIEFIYKSAGVNRPLRANEDHPQDNLNKTYYRDQINKVANAVKEIIIAIKKQSQYPEKVLKHEFEVRSADKKNHRTKIIAGSLILLALIVFGYFFIPKLFKSSKPLEKSVAVLPFLNYSPEAREENTPFVNGLMEEILINLQTIKEFRVPGRTSVEQYRNNTTKSIPDIARELGVNYIVEGSVQKYGNTFRLRVQLIRAKRKEAHLWAQSYTQEIVETKDIFNIQSQIAQAIAAELKAVITPEEKQQIEKIPSTNLTAVDFYHKGREEFFRVGVGEVVNREAVKRAEFYFRKALENDSTFALAYTGLASVYWKKNFYEENYLKNFLDSMLVLADSALAYDDKLAEAYYIRGGYYWSKGNISMAEKEWNKVIRFNQNLWEVYCDKGDFYRDIDDLVGSIENYQKAASLNRGTILPDLLRRVASVYYSAGFPEKGKDYNLKALNLDGDSCKYLKNLVDCEETNGNYAKALELLTKINRIDPTYANLGTQFGLAYMYSGQFKESLKYIKRWEEEGKSGNIISFYLSLHMIGYVYLVNGYKNEAGYYFNKGMEYINSLIKSYKGDAYLFAHYRLACIYAIRGDRVKAYENLKIFNQRQAFSLWYVTSIKNDPFFNNFRNETEFQQIVRDVEAKYQAEHERVRKWLEENNML
jgi:TolB-like protein/Flp pilus assembly protein TadD